MTLNIASLANSALTQPSLASPEQAVIGQIMQGLSSLAEGKQGSNTENLLQRLLEALQNNGQRGGQALTQNLGNNPQASSELADQMAGNTDQAEQLLESLPPHLAAKLLKQLEKTNPSAAQQIEQKLPKELLNKILAASAHGQSHDHNIGDSQTAQAPMSSDSISLSKM